ncbi:MAG: hypothetical protein ACJATP_002843, partial [Candidatus Azotimanducaceae bacterium]
SGSIFEWHKKGTKKGAGSIFELLRSLGAPPAPCWKLNLTPLFPLFPIVFLFLLEIEPDPIVFVSLFS